MFSANGKYTIKENYENDIKKINKNSQLFYDAEGALRASIMISEYGDFNLSTNYGSVKQNLTFNSDGTLKTTGSRMCFDDVCINKDDILKLKQMKVSGNNNSSEAIQAGNKVAATEAARNNALQSAIESKGSVDTTVKQLEDAKIAADQAVAEALLSQSDAQQLVESAKSVKQTADSEVETATTIVENAQKELDEASDSGDTNRIETAQNTKNTADSNLESFKDSQSAAQQSLDTALAEKNAIDSTIASLTQSQVQAGQELDQAKIKQIEAANAITRLSN
jgi:hypothetical protein